MRTTIDLSDDLAVQARKLAAERHTSLKGLGKRVWDDVDADAYVREQREGLGSWTVG